MTSAQPICLPCWSRIFPGTFPWRGPNVNHARICCHCAEATTAGVYINVDPASVPYPSED